MYLVDTNVISELRKVKSGKANPSVVAWSLSIAPPLCHVSVLSILEMEIGVRQMERRDGDQGKRLRQWLDGSVLPFFEGRILVVDRAVALRHAATSVPDPRPERDGLIGATAYIHSLTLVTRNVRDFQGLGLRLLDPWQPL